MIKYGKAEMKYLAAQDPVMEKLISHFGYIQQGGQEDVFCELVMSIVGQMISNNVAHIINERVKSAVGPITPENIIKTGVEKIKGCGMSKRKAEYIVGLAEGVLNGTYDFKMLDHMSDEEAIRYLMQIKGVGRWTAEMIVEFTLGRPDVFSYGDAALRNGIIKAHGFKTLSEIRFERMRKKYSPYCSVASLYYYALNDEK